jgi:hypothetical protein
VPAREILPFQKLTHEKRSCNEPKHHAATNIKLGPCEVCFLTPYAYD